MDPDEVDRVCDQHEEEYWQYCQDKKDAKKETLMSEEAAAMISEEVSNPITVMAGKMYDEVMVTKDLDTVRDNLFRTQFNDSFTHVRGPAGYWTELEREWRAVSSHMPIPTKYRTNKSVILKAHRIDEGLTNWVELNDSGEFIPLGKTAIQNKCMTVEKVSKSGEGMARNLINMIEQYEKDESTTEFNSMLTLLVDYFEARV
jgi:hypothetical protein